MIKKRVIIFVVSGLFVMTGLMFIVFQGIPGWLDNEKRTNNLPVFGEGGLDQEKDWEKIAWEIKANELGSVPVLVYHQIGEVEGRWTRTPANFRQDLQELYDRGYVSVGLNDYIAGNIDIPAGKSPAVITFDDSTTGQFRLKDKNGELEVDPDSAVGILLDFANKHPDFGQNATFFINGYPFGGEPGQREYWQKKLQLLADWGFEIGNHTFSHANMRGLDEETLSYEIAKLQEHIQEALPGYQSSTMAIVQDGMPTHFDLLIEGKSGDTRYSHKGIVLWAWRDALSPYHRDYDPYSIQRIQVFDDEGESSLTMWLNRIEHKRYISDGNSELVSLPKGWEEYLPQEHEYHLNIYDPQNQGYDPRLEEKAQNAKGIHITYYYASSRERWENTINLVENTQLNSIQLDVKDESGYIGFASQVEKAREIGAVKNILPLEEMLADLRRRSIYSIARIVVFRDPVLAQAQPEYMVRTREGTPLGGGVWVNPKSTAVWDYNIELALEAYRLGFDEVQFDYIRFPEGVAAWTADYGPADTRTRVDIITEFTRYAREQIGWDKLLSAAVFGFIGFAQDDLRIGQRAERLGPYLDYISPMVYPSHYGPGNYGFANPNAHPYEIVDKSLQDFKPLLQNTGCRLRPWLQAFTMGFPPYGREEFRAQIEATEDNAVQTWLLWNPHARYNKDYIIP